MNETDNSKTSKINPRFTLSAPGPLHQVDNAEFLREVFRDLRDGAFCWITAFDGDPGAAGPTDWTGSAFDPFSISAGALRGFEDKNPYFCISSFIGHEDPSHPGVRFGAARRKALHAATHAVVLDDIGCGPSAKVPVDRLPALEPGWVLETSPDNWQVGYFLETPVIDGPLAARFLDALVADGLQMEKDPGMKGVTRYVRLPEGLNGKEKYKTGGRGEGWRHRLLHWKPSTRYQLEDLCAGFGLDLGSVRSGASVLGRHAGRSSVTYLNDPWVPILEQAVDRMERPNDKGPDGIWIDVCCPWVSDHGGQEDNGSAYCVGGGYKCNHGHCESRDWGSVRAWLLSHPDAAVRRSANDLAGELDFGLFEILAPDAPPIPETGPDGPAPVRTQDEILKTIEDLDYAVTEEMTGRVRNVLREIDAARLDPIAEDALLDRVHDKTARKKTVLEKALKGLREERVAAALATKTIEIRKSKSGRPYAVIEPGTLIEDPESEKPLIHTDNIERLLEGMRATVRWNQMTLREEYTGALEPYNDDSIVRILQDAMECHGMSRNQQSVVGMLRLIGDSNGYHPMQDFLQGVESWDEVDRLRGEGGLFDTVVLEYPENRELVNKVLSKWLYAVIAAAHHLYQGQPGNQPRGVLVFIGGQHTGKTTWIGRLFQGLFPGSERCFIGGAHFAGSTDDKLNVLGALVTELGEIDSTMNRAEAGQLKAFLSNDTDRVRRPYGSSHVDIPRRTVFAGTVNNAEYLKDQTGSTRFWSISIKRMDLDRQREFDMQQVWSQVQHECREAYAAAKAATDYTPLPWHMSQEEMEKIEAVNAGHRELSGTEEWLLDSFDWDNAEWKALKRGAARAHINGLTLGELQRKYDRSGSLRAKEWKDALRRLTGQEKPVATTAVVTQWTDNGLMKLEETTEGDKKVKVVERKRKNGRLWAMPPPVAGAVTQDKDDESVRQKQWAEWAAQCPARVH